MPEMCVAGDENFSKEKLLSMYSQAEKAYRLFDDDISKLTFEKLTAFKITGKLSYLREIFTDKDKITEILPLGKRDILRLGSIHRRHCRRAYLTHRGKV